MKRTQSQRHQAHIELQDPQQFVQRLSYFQGSQRSRNIGNQSSLQLQELRSLPVTIIKFGFIL